MSSVVVNDSVNVRSIVTGLEFKTMTSLDQNQSDHAWPSLTLT